MHAGQAGLWSAGQLFPTVVSEQWRNRTSSWHSDASATAAIYVLSTQHRVIGSSDPPVSGFVWVELAGLRIYSCNFSPNSDLPQFEDDLGRLEFGLRGVKIGTCIVVSGDAKSVSWGSSITDRRGILLSELAASLQLTPANVGNELTFRRGAGGSVVDVTFSDDGIVGRINNWKVLDDYSHSDHQYIWYEIVGAPAGRGGLIADEIGWCIRSLDVLVFKETFSAGGGTVYSASGAEAMVEVLGVLTKRACDSAMTRRGRGTMRRPRPQKDCAESRAHPGVRQKLRGRSADPYLDDPENLKTVVDGLLPEHPERTRALEVPIDGEDCPLFQKGELERALKGLKAHKAPGPDGVPNEIVSVVGRAFPNVLLDVYNACLREGTFGGVWKRQKLVLIPKKRPVVGPSSYRPLCMLDGFRKLLERLTLQRLQPFLEDDATGLSPLQYGFRQGRSTIHAVNHVLGTVRSAWEGSVKRSKHVALVALNIRNAFNSARWDNILRAVGEDYRVPRYLTRLLESYFEDRLLEYWCGTTGAAPPVIFPRGDSCRASRRALSSDQSCGTLCMTG
ncbi:uncharacterized protein LOC143917758 [Arctopsyche grandis]|uniref:uncharacterized protein LOC143917758 n=1 Tax=Arctopsyche grandis TaxID=121162 RepID=UPI00406D8A36